MVRIYTTDRSSFHTRESVAERILLGLKLPVAVGLIAATFTHFALAFVSNLSLQSINEIATAISGVLATMALGVSVYRLYRDR